MSPTSLWMPTEEWLPAAQGRRSGVVHLVKGRDLSDASLYAPCGRTLMSKPAGKHPKRCKSCVSYLNKHSLDAT